MEDSKADNRLVALKRSRLGPNLKRTIIVARPKTIPAAVPNGNGLSTSNEKSKTAPAIQSGVEKDKASMSVRNKEICRLHMEETNSINNAQNSDSNKNDNTNDNVNESNKDIAESGIKEKPSNSLSTDTKPIVKTENSDSKTGQNGSDVSDIKESIVVDGENSTISDKSNKSGEKNGEPVPDAEKISVKVEDVSNAESVNVQAPKDSSKAEKLVEKASSEVEATKTEVPKPTQEESAKTEVSKSKKEGSVSKLIKEEPADTAEVKKPVKEVSSKPETSKLLREVSVKVEVLKQDAVKTDVKKPTKESLSKTEVSKSIRSPPRKAEVSKSVGSPPAKTEVSKTPAKAEILKPVKDSPSKPETSKSVKEVPLKTEAKKLSVKEITKLKSSPRRKKSKEEESHSSGSEEFHGFDSEHTEKSIKAKKEFIENSEESEVTSSAVSTPAAVQASYKSTPVSNKKMRKNIVDLTNPMFRKPFDFGWKRELVYRATNDDGKRQGDIYYYTPSGKKVRSAREVQEHITHSELSVDNFTFCKEPLGINDSSKEMIRDARVRLSKDFAITPSPKAVPKPKAKATATPVSPSTPKTTPKVVIKTPTPSSGGLKVKFTGIKSGSASAKSSLSKSKPAKVKKRKSSGGSELEMGMLPPMWNSPEVKSDSLSTARSWSPPTVSDSTKSTGKKRSAEKSEKKGSPISKRAKLENDTDSTHVSASSSAAAPVVTTTTPNSMPAQLSQSHYFMMSLAAGYSTLMHIFRYLNLKELLTASRVCRLWHDVASKPHFWQTVRMKNTQVHDWNGFADALIKHETKHLDLRKMLVGTKPDEVKANWLEFYSVIGRVKSLKRIELCRCLSSVIENLAKHVPHLESLTATSIKSPNLNLEPLGAITNLTELRLKGMSGLELSFDHLSNLKSLKLLSITGIKNLDHESSQSIGSLENLETLEIGDCNNIHQKTVTEAIPKLTNLKRLRLEKGQNSVPLIIQLIESASKLPQLEILELINFDVKPGFDQALGQCTNIKSLLMIPTYITQSATTNHIVMVGVSRLASTLKHFVWGLTLELLRVTDLFIDQCESSKNSPAQSPNSNGSSVANKKGKGDSIPILKPLIDTLEEGHDIKDPIPLSSQGGPSKVDILPIPKLRKVLSSILPTTDIKILKIPFNQTWRQTLV